MKPSRLMALFLFASPLAVPAQDAAEMQLSTESQKPKTVISQSPKKRTVEQQRRVEFEGFMVGLLSSNKLGKVFDLTAPVDPVKEKERVVVDRNDGRIIGFKLLSIRF